jgi:hypothetical protein
MRGQIWSMDFAVSIVIFVLVVSVVLFAWNHVTQNSMYQVSLNVLENDALAMSDTLIRVPGMPEDWNASNVRVIGLASEENVLDPAKVLQFVGMDYNQTKRILGIGGYEFYFEVRHLNNTQMSINGTGLTKGTNPSGKPGTRLVIPVERYVMLEGKIAKMEFHIWY